MMDEPAPNINQASRYRDALALAFWRSALFAGAIYQG